MAPNQRLRALLRISSSPCDRRFAAAAAALAAVGAAGSMAHAQDPTPSPEIVWLSDLAGAEVLAAGASTPVGRIEDAIVDLEAGRAGHVALRVGARSVQLPYANLAPEGTARTYRVALTVQEIEGLPAAIAPPLAAPPPAKTTDGEAGGEKVQKREKGEEAAPKILSEESGALADRLVAASSLRGVEVSVAGRVVGQVEDLVFEGRSGALAFVEVQGGTEPGQRGAVTWVPWGACAVRGPEGEGRAGAKVVVALDPKGRGLNDAPGQGAGVLSDPLFRQRIYRFFAVEPPAYEKRP